MYRASSHLSDASTSLIRSLPISSGDYEAVLSLAVADQTLYAGMQDGGIKVFDLETKSVIRTIVGTQVRKATLTESVRSRLTPNLIYIT